MKIKNFIDFFKTGLIYLLTASMLTAAGLYINAKQIAGQIEEIPWEKRIIFELGGMTLAEMNENHIMPVQITITANKNTLTAVNSDKSVLDIYEAEVNGYSIKDALRDIFGKNSKCRVLNEKEGEELWEKCADFDNSVYIKYAGNYIYPFIYIFLDKEWDIRKSNDDFSAELAMVHELFIIDDGEVQAAAKDIYGNVSLFIPNPDAKNKISRRFKETNLSAYKNIAIMLPCDFLKSGNIGAQTGINDNNILNMKFSPSFHIFQNYDKYSNILGFSNLFSNADNTINTSHAYIKNFFKILNFNIENSASYSEKDGITFKDSKNTVKFYSDGQIIYNYKSSDSNEKAGGIHLAKFLSYDDPYYTYYEKIKAASVFVNSLDREMTENECKIYLKNVIITPNGETNVIFAYYYEGIEIKINGSSEAIVLTINENSFTQIKINPLYLSLNRKGIVKNRNPIYDLKLIDYKISDKFIVSEFKLAYNINYDSLDFEKNNTVKPVWELS